MEKIQTSEVIVRIPPSIAADIGNNEIIDLLLGKALGKKDLYKSKIKMFESKYGTSYASFKKNQNKRMKTFRNGMICYYGRVFCSRTENGIESIGISSVV